MVEKIWQAMYDSPGKIFWIVDQLAFPIPKLYSPYFLPSFSIVWHYMNNSVFTCCSDVIIVDLHSDII